MDRFGDTPPVVDSLLDVAQLRFLCNRIGVSQVSCRSGTLVMRVDERFVPDPVALLAAMQETDPRLAVTPRAPTSLLLKSRWDNDRTLLRDAVKVMRRLNERLDAQLKIRQAPAD